MKPPRPQVKCPLPASPLPLNILHLSFLNMSNATRSFRVLADYEVIDPHPLRLRSGQPVQPLRMDPRWPGWVWIQTDQPPQSGWIPAAYLLDPAASTTVCQRDFDGTDLSARRGDILTAIHNEAGWIFARHPDGRTGWFPLFNLKPDPRT